MNDAEIFGVFKNAIDDQQDPQFILNFVTLINSAAEELKFGLFTQDREYFPFPRPSILNGIELVKKSSETILGYWNVASSEELVGQCLSSVQRAENPSIFQTRLLNGKSTIFGADDLTFRSLVGLSHELGHCVFERSGGSFSTFAGLVFSETCALLFEEQLISSFLAEIGSADKRREYLKDWHGYQRAMDCIHFSSAIHIISSFLDPSERENMRKICPISQSRIALRSSHIMRPGYEICYMFASVLRTSFGSGTSEAVGKIFALKNTVTALLDHTSKCHHIFSDQKRILYDCVSSLNYATKSR